MASRATNFQAPMTASAPAPSGLSVQKYAADHNTTHTWQTSTQSCGSTTKTWLKLGQISASGAPCGQHFGGQLFGKIGLRQVRRGYNFQDVWRNNVRAMFKRNCVFSRSCRPAASLTDYLVWVHLGSLPIDGPQERRVGKMGPRSARRGP